MPLYRSAPDDDEAMKQIMEMQTQITALLKVQACARNFIHRIREAEELRRDQEAAAVFIQAHTRGRIARGWPKWMRYDPASGESPFTVRNLDTGEATTVTVNTRTAPLLTTMSFGSLQRGSSAWDNTRQECRGLLEKLASKSTISFRQYQLCVWQERYVFAEDDALCYQQLALDRTPTGKCKKIPYSSIQFVGPYDETQFVLKCERRSYTFLCPTEETRTMWIKNISMLAGCSASTEVCRHTTRESKRGSRNARTSLPPVSITAPPPAPAQQPTMTPSAAAPAANTAGS